MPKASKAVVKWENPYIVGSRVSWYHLFGKHEGFQSQKNIDIL